MQSQYPKITIVTPVYNQVDYLEATITSVISQNYPNLEYIVIDGGSTDGTVEVIKKYESYISYWVTELDDGMYDALNKGFGLSTGDIMGWINSDDILLSQALFNVARLFNELPQVSWLQGLNCVIDHNGKIVDVLTPKRFSFITVLNGDYRWIQQESTFWKRGLWDKAGGFIQNNLKLAGDFELWFRFFQLERLYYVNISLGAWRKRPGQLSVVNFKTYNNEVLGTIGMYTRTEEQLLILKKIRWLSFIIRKLKKIKVFNLDLIEKKRTRLLQINAIDIKYSYRKKKFRVK